MGLHRELGQDAPRFSKVWCGIPAALFAFFMVFGRSFEKTDSWDLVFGSMPDFLLSLAQGIGWFLAFYLGISFLFGLLDKAGTAGAGKSVSHSQPGILRRIWRKYWTMVETRPIATVWGTLLLVNLPYMVLSYPAIFMGDTGSQLSQGFGEATLTNHHPVIHTLFLSLFVRMGELLGNENAGVFLYCLAQAVFVCLVLAYAAAALVEIKAPPALVGGIVLYYCIHPRISSYLFLLTKDVPYSACVTLFYVLLFKLTAGPAHRKKRDHVLFGAAVLGMICFRNEGKYMVVFTLLAFLFWKGFRKKAAAFLGIGAAAAVLLNQVLIPAMGVTPGSIREMLSVPFQQTARYVRDAGEDVTPEEREVIDRVLDYDSLAENYDPGISDNVKATYHGTTEDLLEYFRVWFQMFLRHPGIYIQATMNNYYQYFYPGETLFSLYSYEWSDGIMEDINEKLGTDYHYPESLWEARNSLEAVREDIFSLPALSFLNMPAFYTWGAILYFFYFLRRKSWKGVLFSVPMLVQMLIFITGPTNGFYCRYEFSMLLYLPVVWVFSLAASRRRQSQQAWLMTRRGRTASHQPLDGENVRRMGRFYK